MQCFDVAVLGAGIVGCACARELTQAGLHVCVIEAAVPGGATTAAGMGHVVVMDDSPAQLALTQYSRALWQELQPAMPATIEYQERGTIWVAADEEEMREVVSKQRTYAAVGIRAEVLDENGLAQAEPNLRRGLAGGLLIPEDIVISPPAAAGFFLSEALHGGATLLKGHPAISIDAGIVTLENGTRLYAPQILVATGVDRHLLPWLPIQKRKGHLVMTEPCPGFAHHQLVELGYLKSAHMIESDSVAFNVQPRRPGHLLIGSSRQYGNEEPAADEPILSAMLERAQSYMPALAKLAPIRVWTGFRAATPDKLPYLGPTADPGLFIAMGLEGLGTTNAPGAARLMADHLLGRVSAINPTPYLPSRVPMSGAVHA